MQLNGEVDGWQMYLSTLSVHFDFIQLANHSAILLFVHPLVHLSFDSLSTCFMVCTEVSLTQRTKNRLYHEEVRSLVGEIKETITIIAHNDKVCD